MLILKYFFTVGLFLMGGLFAVSAYLESESIARVARAHAKTSLPVAAPVAPVVEPNPLEVMVGPVKPDKPAKASTTTRQSGQANRGEHRR